MNIGITISLYNRPSYTNRVLEKLSKCYDVDRYPIYISIDGSPEIVEILDIVEDHLPGASVSINNPKKGCGGNIRHCLEWGFQKHDTIIHIEDDILLATDSLIYFANTAEIYHNDPKVFTVCAYNRDTKAATHEALWLCERRCSFYPWGVMWFKHKYEQVKHLWINEPWDVNMKEIVKNNNWEVIVPLVNRVINIGAKGGVHTPSALWHINKHRQDLPLSDDLAGRNIS